MNAISSNTGSPFIRIWWKVLEVLFQETGNENSGLEIGNLGLTDPSAGADPLGLDEPELALAVGSDPWLNQIIVHAVVLRQTMSVKRSGRMRNKQATSKAVPIIKTGQYCSKCAA